jgi:hypothetical protein
VIHIIKLRRRLEFINLTHYTPLYDAVY